MNAFDWFVERLGLLPPLPGLAHAGPVEVEYQARFPWPGGGGMAEALAARGGRVGGGRR